MKRRFVREFDGKAQGACISFESPALLFRVLSGKRWELLATMTGAGPMTIREAARRAGRDVKAVHGDVRALLYAGILRKTETGKWSFLSTPCMSISSCRRLSERRLGEGRMLTIHLRWNQVAWTSPTVCDVMRRMA